MRGTRSSTLRVLIALTPADLVPQDHPRLMQLFESGGWPMEAEALLLLAGVP